MRKWGSRVSAVCVMRSSSWFLEALVVFCSLNLGLEKAAARAVRQPIPSK